MSERQTATEETLSRKDTSNQLGENRTRLAPGLSRLSTRKNEPAKRLNIDDVNELLILEAGVIARIPYQPLPLLSPKERKERIVALLKYWASGYRRVHDERLFCDIFRRRAEAARAIKKLRRAS